MTEPDTTELDEAVFWMRHDGGYSIDAITEALQLDGYEISRETVRKILNGLTHTKQTEALRKRYPLHARTSPGSQLTAEQYAAIFDAYHDEEQSLAQIARDHKGLTYVDVRQVLRGENQYAEPTVELRERYPAYQPRTGRHSRKTPPLEVITEVFRVYFDEKASLAETSRRTGVTRGQIKALIEGWEAPKLTFELRTQYSSTLRYAGPPTGPDWYKARGLDPGTSG